MCEETSAVTSETTEKENIFRGVSAAQSQSVDLAVTSEIIRRSYITRQLNFSQGQTERQAE